MRVGLETRLGQVERRIAAMIRVIEDGLHQPAMKEQMIALETEEAQITAEVATKPSVRPVVLHPNLPEVYRKKVEELEAVLADPELGPEAMAAIRSMIGRIVLTPGEGGGVEAVLEGDLARILAICAGTERKSPHPGGDGGSGSVLGDRLSVVAGARNTLEALTSARGPDNRSAIPATEEFRRAGRMGKQRQGLRTELDVDQGEGEADEASIAA